MTITRSNERARPPHAAREPGANGGRRRFLTVVAVAVPVLLALALGAVSVLLTERTAYATSLERRVQAQEREAYYQLHGNVTDMQNALLKLRASASSTRHITLLSDVWRLSGAAATNLASVPSYHAETGELNSFILRAGDYADSLISRILEGNVLSSDDYAQLDALYEKSVQIGDEIAERIDNNDFPSYQNVSNYYADDAAAGAAQTDQNEEAQRESAGDGQNDEGTADYPTLIYDGPFSESNEKPNPRGLPAGMVDENKALQNALAYLGGGSLTLNGTEEGDVPTYLYTGTDAIGRAVEIAITRQGGATLWMMAAVAEGAQGENSAPNEEATERFRQAASLYLERHGYADMEATYAQYYNGIAVLNYAATQDGVILYADLVKVYVEQASAQIVGIDARNYLTSHTRRTLPQTRITQDEARHAVSDALEIRSERLALIPQTASTETLCYEFKGTIREISYIVYINALTGAEEEIFRILDSESGQLVV